MNVAMIARRPPAVLEVACPDCAAAPGASCKDPAGHVRYLDHLARTRAAVLVRTHGCAAVLSTEAHATAGVAL